VTIAFQGGGRSALLQASSFCVRSSTDVGSSPSASWAIVTVSSTSRSASRAATQTGLRISARPWYSTASGRTPYTETMGPSTARMTSAIVTA
jgi:hypothetical protein